MRALEGGRLVVASHNRGKLEEFARLLAQLGVETFSVADLGLPEPEETGETFEENAFIKAHAAAVATGLPALSDDSGLVIDALGGEPGVRTANWAEMPGGGRDFGKAMRCAEDRLNAAGATIPADRAGRFVSVLCMAWPDGHAEYFRGEVEGTMVWPPRGEKGFGFDPAFLPDGHDRTFGEMETAEKQGLTEPLSHRARAFALLKDALAGKAVHG